MRTYGDADLSNLQQVLASGSLTARDGGFVTRFEHAFATLVGARYAVARSAATTSMVQALGLCDPQPGDEVICDPLVDFGAVAARYFQAIPRFADVHPGTFLMDPQSARRLVTPRTRALIVTHLWGLCADLDQLRALCDQHGLLMIEDTADTIGASWQGRPAGSFGHVAVWAFQPTKQIGLADAGMLTTGDPALAARLPAERAAGMQAPPFTLDLRLHELTGAVGLAQVQRAPDYVAYYTRSLDFWNEAIAGCPWLTPREVPPASRMVGYWWSCVWHGDRYGLDYARFQRLCADLQVPVQFGFNQVPANHQQSFERQALHHRREGTRSDRSASPADAHVDPCPVAEDLMPRLITTNLIEVPHDEAQYQSAAFRQAIRRLTS